MSKLKNLIRAAAVLAVPVMLLSACGTASNTADGGSTNSPDAKTVTIGLNTKTDPPYDFLNENGDVDGYEYALLAEADKLLPEYKFEFKPLDWTNLLVSLDTGKIDVAGSSLQLNDERKQKYNYTDPEANYITKLAVPENSTVTGIEDLAGKTIYSWNGDANTTILEDYNKAHPDKAVKIAYGDWSTEQVRAAVQSGAAAAYPESEVGNIYKNKQYQAKTKLVGEPLAQDNVVFLVKKGDDELTAAINKSLSTLRENGTLKKLSEQYLGGDFSQPVEKKSLQ